MTLREVIDRLDKQKEFKDSDIRLDLFAKNNFQLENIEDASQKRFVCYFLLDWVCDESYVGARVYFFDDKPVAYSTQMDSHSDEYLYWFSKEDFENLKKYMMTFYVEPKKYEPEPNIIDLDADFEFGKDGDYMVFCSSEELTDYKRRNAYYNDDKVVVIKSNKPIFNEQKKVFDYFVQIGYPDGRKLDNVNMLDLKFRLNLKEDEGK